MIPIYFRYSLAPLVILSLSCSGVIGEARNGGNGSDHVSRTGGGQGGAMKAPTAASTPGGGLPDPAAGGRPEPAAIACAAAAPPRATPTPLRRLTRFEYNNTVRDLLGTTTRLGDGFAADGQAYGFDNIAHLQRVTRLQAEQYQAAAVELAAGAMPGLARLLPCDPQKIGDDDCANQFITTFAKRAYRRPIEPDETARLVVVYGAGKAGGDFKTGIELVIQTVLQAPGFLYRVETRPGPWVVASRLSYLLWGTMPDDQLFRAAEAGQLTSRDQIVAQARRMLMDARGHHTVAEMYRQWLRLEEVGQIEKDRKVYPAFTPDLPALWRTETATFLDQTLWQGGGFRTLFSASFSFVNAKLAAYYGITAPPGAGFGRVPLDPAQRGAGILTQASLLALLAKSNQSSPVHRGLFVRERLLCQPLPPPPANIEIKAPELSANLTTRERFTDHARSPACSGCHRLVDPLGLGFESFDGIGKWRSIENGKPVDTSGEVVDADIAGRFVGAAELGQKLSDSEDARRCQAQTWFRFAHGRAETPDDACVLDALRAAMAGPGAGVQELLLALVDNPNFRGRP